MLKFILTICSKCGKLVPISIGFCLLCGEGLIRESVKEVPRLDATNRELWFRLREAA
jgi:rRNA maturation endonuclease Nob1